MFVFNRNRYIAFISMLIVSILIWYNTILLTNDCDENSLPVPNQTQIMGLALGLFSTSIWWLKQCMTINPRTKNE
tara:strand:- start:499 stop:723 length:225 start_codon:yes stop_codon:yes gene_type:complete